MFVWYNNTLPKKSWVRGGSPFDGTRIFYVVMWRRLNVSGRLVRCSRRWALNPHQLSSPFHFQSNCKSIAAVSSARRGISSYPSLMASSPAGKDVVSTQNNSNQKTQQPLQVIRFPFLCYINIFLANLYANSSFFHMGFVPFFCDQLYFRCGFA